MVIALTIVLALGLSVGVASAYDWEVDLDGFSDGNFTAGGTIFGATPGYFEGLDSVGYYMETGALVTMGTVELVGFGNQNWGVTKLDDPFSCNRTDGKTIDAFQKLQQSEIITGDSLVTTYMYSSYSATDYPVWEKFEQVVNSMFYDYTYQWIIADGSGPGSASMYSTQQITTRAGVGGTLFYGLLGVEVALGEFDFDGGQIVNYWNDTGDLSGDVDIDVYWNSTW